MRRQEALGETVEVGFVAVPAEPQKRPSDRRYGDRWAEGLLMYGIFAHFHLVGAIFGELQGEIFIK